MQHWGVNPSPGTQGRPLARVKRGRLRKAFWVLRLCYRRLDPQDWRLAPQVPRHLVHTPPPRGRGRPRHRAGPLRSTQTRQGSGEVYSLTRLHAEYWHTFGSRECAGTSVTHPPPFPPTPPYCRGPSGWLLWIDVHVGGVSEETDPLLLFPLLCHLHREKWISEPVGHMTFYRNCSNRQAELDEDIEPQRKAALVQLPAL